MRMSPSSADQPVQPRSAAEAAFACAECSDEELSPACLLCAVQLHRPVKRRRHRMQLMLHPQPPSAESDATSGAAAVNSTAATAKLVFSSLPSAEDGEDEDNDAVPATEGTASAIRAWRVAGAMGWRCCAVRRAWRCWRVKAATATSVTKAASACPATCGCIVPSAPTRTRESFSPRGTRPTRSRAPDCSTPSSTSRDEKSKSRTAHSPATPDAHGGKRPAMPVHRDGA